MCASFIECMLWSLENPCLGQKVTPPAVKLVMHLILLSCVLLQLNALRHTRNQCDKDPHYSQNNCYVNCFMASLLKENLTCRLPYMTGKINHEIFKLVLHR